VISIGEFNELKVLHKTSAGFMLGDVDNDEVLLPDNLCPNNVKLGDTLTVFVYHDKSNIKIASTLIPKILLHEFALLKVNETTPVGAFLDWGLEKDLLVPFKEQQTDMAKGEWHIIYLDIDEKNQLFGSTLIDKQLQNIHITVKEGEQVELIIYQKSDLGYNVIVNNEHLGLIFENEIFTKLNIGDRRKGFVKNVREDNKLDITLQATGYRNASDFNCEIIYKALEKNNGFLEITDKSAPDKIYGIFGISKKAFKRSIGTLYKQRKIIIESTGIKLIV